MLRCLTHQVAADEPPGLDRARATARRAGRGRAWPRRRRRAAAPRRGTASRVSRSRQPGRLLPLRARRGSSPSRARRAPCATAPAAGRRLPLPAPVPEDHDRELEPLGLVHGQDLHGLAADRVRRVELDGIDRPIAQPRRRGVVVEPLGRRESARARRHSSRSRVSRWAPFGPERDGAARTPVRSSRSRAVAPGGRSNRRAPQLPHELAGRARTASRSSARRLRPPRARTRSAQVDGEERRPEQRGLGDAVVAVGERAQAEQELAVQRILTGRACRRARCTGCPRASSAGNSSAQPPGGDGQHGDVAVAARGAARRSTGSTHLRRRSPRPASADSAPALGPRARGTRPPCLSPSPKSNGTTCTAGPRVVRRGRAASGWWKTRPVGRVEAAGRPATSPRIRSKRSLSQAISGGRAAEVGRRASISQGAARATRCAHAGRTWRCRRGGSGRSTASGSPTSVSLPGAQRDVRPALRARGARSQR